MNIIEKLIELVEQLYQEISTQHMDKRDVYAPVMSLMELPFLTALAVKQKIVLKMVTLNRHLFRPPYPLMNNTHSVHWQVV